MVVRIRPVRDGTAQEPERSLYRDCELFHLKVVVLLEYVSKTVYLGTNAKVVVFPSDLEHVDAPVARRVSTCSRCSCGFLLILA